MQLHSEIKKHRTAMNLSQEQLAEKVYVTRQTISNWENDKSYPDIHSLLLLSSTFHISLDQLIKGDVTIMSKKINEEELKKFNRDGAIFTCLLVLSMTTILPLIVFFKLPGLLLSLSILAVSMFYALRLERFKKENDIQTYKEIISFVEGKQLDEIEKAKELGKRPYQQFFLAFLCGLLTLLISMIFIWILKSYIF